MWKRTLLLSALATSLLSAAPASGPEEFDGRVFAMSLIGFYSHEDALVRDALDDTKSEFYRTCATQAAICNEWNGPFRLRDFALWLQETHLDKRLCLGTARWDNDPSFKHLPSSLQKLSIEMRIGRVPAVAVFAVDGTLAPLEVESVLKNPAKTAAGGGPIVYGITPVSCPRTMMAPGE